MAKYEIEYLATNWNQRDLVKLLENHFWGSSSPTDLCIRVKNDYRYVGVYTFRENYDSYHPGWDIYKTGTGDPVDEIEYPVGEIVIEYFSNSMTIKYCVYDAKLKKQLMRLINLMHSDLEFIGFKITPRIEVQKRAPRKDAVEKVALALYFEKHGDFPTRVDAAKRMHTTTQTIKALEDNKDVIELISSFEKNHDKAVSLRQKHSQKMSKNVLKPD